MSELKGKNYHIITFGCQMNEHDSEVISGLLTQRGCNKTADRSQADIVVINTCSVRDNADKRFFGTLGQLKKQKATNSDFTVCVCGCMMQQDHVVKEIKQKYPWVDLVFGTHNIDELPSMLQRVYENRSRLKPVTDKHQIRSSKDSRLIRIYDDREDIVEGLPSERLFRHKAFVNITYGCNNFCTYCIVPYTRGREKSRAPEDIIGEIKKLSNDGVREVTLLGQNVNSYKGEGEIQCDFTDLIYRICDIDGIDRIRFMTSHPKDLSDKLIKAFGECDKLCKYIHLPVQAGSDRILERMNRKYDVGQYKDLVRSLRKEVPNITISTDIIVGFPGEREEDFEQTIDLVEEIRYDSAFTFLYSPRKGTPAAEYTDQIPEDVKHRRFDRLVEIMNDISIEKNSKYVDGIYKVLVDGPARKEGSGMMSGRTDGFKLVNFVADPSAAGTMINVRITEAKTFSLNGTVNINGTAEAQA